MTFCLDQIHCVDTLKRMMDDSEDLEYRREVRAKIRKIKKEEGEKPIQPPPNNSYYKDEIMIKNNTKNKGISDENNFKTNNISSKNNNSLKNISANNNFSTTKNNSTTNNNYLTTNNNYLNTNTNNNYLTSTNNQSSTNNNNNSPTTKRLKTKVNGNLNVNSTTNQTETKIKLKKVLRTQNEGHDDEKNDKLNIKSELNNKRMTTRQIKDDTNNEIDLKHVKNNNNKINNNNTNNNNNKSHNNKMTNKSNNNNNNNTNKSNSNNNNINKSNTNNNTNINNNNNNNSTNKSDNNNKNVITVDFGKVKNNLNNVGESRKEEQNKIQSQHTNTSSIITHKRVQAMTPRIARKMFKSMDEEKDGRTSRASSVPKCFNPNTAKEKILAWCKGRLEGYENIEVTNFSSSWSNGLAFCALANSYFPSEFDYDALSADNKEHNFRLAFDTLSEKGGVPALLDVDDMLMTSRPDWKCVFTYVNSIISTMRELRQKGGMD